MSLPAESLKKGGLFIAVAGDVLSTNAHELRSRADSLLAERKSGDWDFLELDLSRASMVDSVGLNLLVYLLKEVGRLGKKMRVRITNPNLQRLFRFTRLDKHVEVILN